MLFFSLAESLMWFTGDAMVFALFVIRLTQPLIILAIVIISVLAKPVVDLAKFVFAPHPDQIRAATTIYGTNINGTGSGSIFGRRTPSSELSSGVAAHRSTNDPAQPTLQADEDEHSQPTPVIVPVRSRRRILTFIVLSALAATYFASGAFIVLRAVLPPQTWTPDLARWKGLDWHALLGMVAWCSVAIAIAYEESTRGRGQYGRGKVAWSCVAGLTGDVALLGLYISSKHTHLDELLKSKLWVIVQLALLLLRIVLLYPLAFMAVRWDSTTYVRASTLAQRISPTAGTIGNVEASIGEQSRLTETSSLLAAQPRKNGTSKYGATLSSSTAAKPSDQPGNGSSSSGTRSPNPNAANASMGLTLAAQPPPPTFKVFFERIRVLFPYLWPSQSLHLQLLALLCVGLLVIGRFVNLFVPLTLGKIVSDLSDGIPPWWHIALYATLKMLQGSGGLLTVMQALAWLPIEQFSDRSISIMAFDHLLHLSMAFHTKRKMGEILRILDRGAVISSFFQYLIFNVLPIFVDIAVAMLFLGSKFGPAVGVAIFSVMFLYTYVSVTMTTWRTGLRREANNKDSISRAIHADVLINYELVKVHSNEPYELDRYRAALLDYQLADYRVTASLNLLNLVQTAIITTSTLITCLIVARSVVLGYTKSSDFVVFITYLQQVYVPLGFLGTLHRVLMQNLVDTDKLMNLLEEESDVKDVPGAKDLVVTEGVIEFRDVIFSYDGKVDALKGVNFTVNANESAALVGESGAGKSSIMRLLYRFYDIQQGQILIDGQDISKVRQASLRKAIGIVPQEPGLFNTSIYQNIVYGNINASDEEVEAAARAAQIYDRIMSFPEGWRTVVGERGVKLSGGEKQRIALARTFLKNPKILLLDEATSALDTHTEKQLQGALRTILQGRTSLTIAHRLSTIVNSDRIVVLDQGRAVENGGHAELIERNGLYKGMWMQQIKTDEEARQAAEQELPEEDVDKAKAKAAHVLQTHDAVNDKQAKADETPPVVAGVAGGEAISVVEADSKSDGGRSKKQDPSAKVAFPSTTSTTKDLTDAEDEASRSGIVTPKRKSSLTKSTGRPSFNTKNDAEATTKRPDSGQDREPNLPTSASKDTLRSRISSLIRSRTSGAHDRSASSASASTTSTPGPSGSALQASHQRLPPTSSSLNNKEQETLRANNLGQEVQHSQQRSRTVSRTSIESLPAEEMPPSEGQAGTSKKRRK